MMTWPVSLPLELRIESFFERQVGALACQGFEGGGQAKLEPCKEVNRGTRFGDLPMSRYRLFRYG